MEGKRTSVSTGIPAHGRLKGLILSGGKGTRLRPFTYTGAKQLVPIANKPVLFYAIEDLVACGIQDIGIVVGDTADQIRAAVGDGSRFGASVTYIPQSAPLGLAHAVAQAEPFLQTDRFVMYLGDNFLRGGIRAYVEEFLHGQEHARILLRQVAEPQHSGVAVLKDGRLSRLVEKPREFISDLAIIGIYMFDAHVFEAAKNIRPSARGELEITDAIQWLLDHDFTVGHRVVQAPWIDTGKMSDMLEANRLILETIEGRIEGRVDASSTLQGQVIVEAGAQIIHSVLRGPLTIGQNTVVRESYIGPFTAIDHDCVVDGCEIEYSIVLESSNLRQIEQRIEESMIGRYVEVDHAPERPRAHRLVLGDHSRVRLS
jgi:glucose-1-phosphate thymidylyltransferase